MHPPNCHYHVELCRELYHPETPVPEPATVWMVAAALAIAVIFVRKH